jgi:hypothetical protein
MTNEIEVTMPRLEVVQYTGGEIVCCDLRIASLLPYEQHPVAHP